MIESQTLRGLAALLLAWLLALAPLQTFAQDAPDSREELLNHAPLEEAISPRSKALDNYLDQLLDSLLEEDMTTYQQVKACYDYVVDNTAYGNHMGFLNTPVSPSVTCGDIYYRYGEVEGFGSVALTAQTGMCNAYASAFILMVRKLGLDACLVKGSTKSGGGGYAYHEWAEVELGDDRYLFDPQLEQDLTQAGMARYTVFCRTYDQVPGRYLKN